MDALLAYSEDKLVATPEEAALANPFKECSESANPDPSATPIETMMGSTETLSRPFSVPCSPTLSAAIAVSYVRREPPLGDIRNSQQPPPAKL